MKSKPTAPLSEADWERVFRLRCQSKKGFSISQADTDFCARAWREDSARYESMNRAVFEATKPFGA